MRRKLTNEEFIKKSKLIHGEKYDYSKLNYTQIKSKEIIICPIHGEFKQILDNHLHGMGCKMCGRQTTKEKQQLTTEKFIENAKLVHGNKYNYSLSKYINNYTKIEIICPIHGLFSQIPINHINKKRDCYKCGILKIKNKTKKNTNSFLLDAEKIHNKKYNYSLTEYDGAHKKLKIICKKHGIFMQTPDNHLHGKGCINCSSTISKPQTEFLNYINVKTQNISIPEWKYKKVDGFDKKTNTIYEFLGDFYHGNPKKFDLTKYNPKCHKTFGELYDNTFKIFEKLKNLGYNIKYIWESDWNNFKNKTDPNLNILTF